MPEDAGRRQALVNRSSLPPRQVLETACCLVTDTSNGVSAVKVGDVRMDPELERAIAVIDDNPGTRLVLRRAHDGSVALVVEQAIAPIHHEARRASDRGGLLSHLISRFWLRVGEPGTTSSSEPAPATMKELP
jgi:hypothetical protein